ncbi:MAG: hypothetical protein JJ900_16310 [Rhodospirillales bacterium]|nr:hypothetical protein [Rhodospirillales bacterium]MBO6788413.1 hypothetical protein [Rhodospirillales bacterium]
MTATAVLAAPLLLGACSSTSDDNESIVAASPTAITVTTLRFAEPTAIAERHCAKHGRKAVSRGGVKLGVGYKTMWGFDCVDPQ